MLRSAVFSSGMPDRPAPATGPANPRLVLWIIAIGLFMQLLDSTIVNTALPAMARSLGESPLQMQAVVISYALTMAVVIPATGWLADRFGTQNVFMLAIALFTAGSIACAVSASLDQLIAARVLQGVGGAMLMPVGRLVVLRAFPKEQFLEAISFVAIPALVGPLIGPTLGGWLVEVASWHWIFLINVPVGLAGLAATQRWIPNFASDGAGRFDLGGYLLLQLALGYSPAQAGMLMLPVALAGMAAKRATTVVITHLGYRPVLIANTLLLGTMIAAFTLMGPAQPLWLRIVQLAAFGAVNSFQFTAMNAVTLKDLAPARAASGNSLFSMVQMLGMSLGVTCAAALLTAFSDWLGASQALAAFRATFVAIGLMTLGSAAIFWQLREEGPPAAPSAEALPEA